LHGVVFQKLNAEATACEKRCDCLADVGADVIAVEAPEGAWQRHWSSGDIWHDGQGMVSI
jgi:hypothetical protein